MKDQYVIIDLRNMDFMKDKDGKINYYDSLPEEWRSKNPNPYGDITFIYFGEVNGMKGHAYLQCIKTGKPFILHTDELLPLTENEL